MGDRVPDDARMTMLRTELLTICDPGSMPDVCYVDNIAIHHTGAPLADALRRALEPFFRVTPQPSASNLPPIDVYCLADDTVARYAGVFAQAPVRYHIVANGLNERVGMSQLRYQQVGLYWSATTGCVVVVDPTARTMGVVSRSDTLFRDVKTVVRNELLYRQLEHAGAIAVHAAGVVKHGAAVLMLGHKGAGKTSLSLPFVLGRQAELLATDLAFLAGNEQQVMVKGAPEAMTIGLGTLVEHAALHPLIPSQYAPLRRGDPRLWSITDKIDVPIQRLAELLHVPLAGAWCPCTLLLFPVIERTAGHTQVTDLAPADVERRLLENILSPLNSDSGVWLEMVPVSRAVFRATAARVAAQVAATVPGREVVFNGQVDALTDLTAAVYS